MKPRRVNVDRMRRYRERAGNLPWRDTAGGRCYGSVGGGEYGHHTAGLIYGDAVEYGPDDRFLFGFDERGFRSWIEHPDGTTTDLPEPPMPEGEFVPAVTF